MTKKRDFLSRGSFEEPEPLPEFNAALATECTGLMPTPPRSEAELESYRELSDLEAPRKLPSRKEIREGVYDSPPPEVHGAP